MTWWSRHQVTGNSTSVPAVRPEAVMAWLDAGRPEPNEIADRIDRAVEGVIRAAGSP